MNDLQRFNVRVYGICCDAQMRILITDERRNNVEMTKFPGGGLDFGEGLSDGLMREFREETDTEIEIVGLFYINDFLQISAFNPKDQLLCIYYVVRMVGNPGFEESTMPRDFAGKNGDSQCFRWVSVDDLEQEEFTFPIDRIVVTKILAHKEALQFLAHDGDLANIGSCS